MKGSRALTSCKLVAADSNLRHGRRLRTETSTFLHRHYTSWSGWRKSPMPPPTGCKVELEIEHRSSK